MEENKLNAKHSVYSTFCAYFFSLLTSLIGTFLVITLYTLFTSRQLPSDFFTKNSLGYLLSVIFLDVGLVAIFIFFNKGKQNKIIGKVKLTKILLYILIAAATLFMLTPLTICLDRLFAKMQLPVNQLTYPLNTKNFLVSIVSIAIIPPICEELLFRGLIFKGLKGYGKAFSIFISSVLFALFHMSVNQIVYPILFGCLLALIMYKENNIIYAIIMHITNNFLSLLLAYLNVNLSYNHWTFILVSIILAVAFICLIIYFMFKNNKNSKTKEIGQYKLYLAIAIILMIVLLIITTITLKLGL